MGTTLLPRRSEATPAPEEDPRIAERRRGVAADAKRRRRRKRATEAAARRAMRLRLAGQRARYRAKMAPIRQKRGIRRMVAEVLLLPPTLREAYRAATPEVRLLIRAQARDARRPFDSHGPDFAKVLAVVGRR